MISTEDDIKSIFFNEGEGEYRVSTVKIFEKKFESDPFEIQIDIFCKSDKITEICHKKAMP